MNKFYKEKQKHFGIHPVGQKNTRKKGKTTGKHLILSFFFHLKQQEKLPVVKMKDQKVHNGFKFSPRAAKKKGGNKRKFASFVSHL